MPLYLCKNKNLLFRPGGVTLQKINHYPNLHFIKKGVLQDNYKDIQNGKIFFPLNSGHSSILKPTPESLKSDNPSESRKLPKTKFVSTNIVI